MKKNINIIMYELSELELIDGKLYKLVPINKDYINNLDLATLQYYWRFRPLEDTFENKLFIFNFIKVSKKKSVLENGFFHKLKYLLNKSYREDFRELLDSENLYKNILWGDKESDSVLVDLLGVTFQGENIILDSSKKGNYILSIGE